MLMEADDSGYIPRCPVWDVNTAKEGGGGINSG
jgi:hypothetical protein